ncbi:LysE family transporter [Longispora sp. NPDC051575]|uniref:LysE family translocator n=1 Tax=Longispora sp. NPDC051575 TaxID=3154943 RepID=UPI00341CAE2D
MITAAFLAASGLVIVTPGPDTILVAGLVVRSGRRREGLLAAVGMIAGGVVHATLAIAGLALLTRGGSALVTGLRIGGAVLLLLWGLSGLHGLVRSRRRGAPEPPAAGPLPAAAPLAAGLLSTLANPKVALFLLVFLPQFVAPGPGQTGRVALLAAVHLGLAAVWLCLWTELVLRVRAGLTGGPVGDLTRLAVSLLFLVLGVRLLFA